MKLRIYLLIVILLSIFFAPNFLTAQVSPEPANHIQLLLQKKEFRTPAQQKINVRLLLDNQTQFYVNDNSITGDKYTAAIGNDTNPGTSSAPFATIQHAINVAAAGDTIYVDAGTYIEQDTVTKSLTILGSNASVNSCSGTRVAESVILPASSQPFYDGTTEVRMLQITASNVTIKGLTFDGDNAAISGGTVSVNADINAADGIDIYADVQNITIQNNILKNLNETGVQALPSSGVTLQNNTISNNQFVNIAGNFDAGYPFSGYGIGVLVYNNFYAAINNNCITNARIGIQTGNYNSAGSPASISNNQIESRSVGVWYNLHYQSASNWIISGNNLTTRAGATTNTGVLVSSIQSGVSSTITNNNVTGAKWGVELWNNPTTNPITVSGGTLTNCETGAFANNYDSYGSDGETSSYTLSGINITSNAANNIGIHVKGNVANTNNATTTVQVQNSTVGSTAASSTGLLVTGGGAFASFTGAGTPVAFTGQSKYITLTGNGTDAPATGVNATAVTFDGQTGASASLAQNFAIEDKIDHKIDALTLGFVLVKANNDYITTNSFVAPNTTALVQRGVDAASNGFTVNVGSGAFSDNVVVNKEVIIAGQGSASTTVYPATSNPVGSGGTLGGNTIFLIRANNVTIRDLTADGNNPNIGGAIDARNGIVTDFNSGDYTNLVVHHTTVKNIYYRGIFSMYRSTPGNTFNFHHNTVTNIQGDAGSIAILNIGNSGIIDSNKVTNSGDAIAANQSTGTIFSNNTTSGTGIHTDNNGGNGGTTDTLKNNTVSNVGAGKYGILVFQPSRNVLIEENTITGSYIAIGNVGQGAGGITPVFRRNTIDGQGFANSTGVSQTTSIPGFSPSNVSGTYLNNFINNNQQGFYLKQEAGYTSTIVAHENSITGNPTSVAIAAGPDGAGTLTNNFSCNWYGGAAPVVTGGTLNYQPTLLSGTDNEPATPGFQPVPGSCSNCATPDVIAPTITLKPNPTVFLTTANTYTVQLSDMLQSVSDNCDPNPSVTVSTLNVNCSNLEAGSTSTSHQAYVSNASAGNANYDGQFGMSFKVNSANGVVIDKLGAFDDQGNGTGITGNQGGGVRVAIFNVATQAIVAGLDVTISGTTDPLVGNYRMRSITPVTLAPGNYAIITKGYVGEKFYNRNLTGPLNPAGDNAGGALTFLNTVYYGNAPAFGFPNNSGDAGNPNEYISGTFNYALSASNNVTITATDVSGNTSTATATVTVIDSFYVLTTKTATVNLNANGQASIMPADVLQSLKNNCGVDVTSSTFQVSPSSFTCADISGGGVTPSADNHQAYVSNTTAGNANYDGQFGMSFKVNDANGVSIDKLGAFDDQGNGITGNQGGGVRVAIFNIATQAIVAGLDVTISGATDPLTGSYRMRSITPVTLAPGNYAIITKGYVGEKFYNRNLTGALNPVGDNAGGALSFLNTVYYGNVAAFGFPDNAANAGNPNEYISGTFNYKTLVATGTTVTLTATDVYGNKKQATAQVVVKDVTGPTVITKNITLNLNSSGMASITANDVLQTPVTDNCAVQSVTVSPNSFTCADYSGSGNNGTPHQAYISNTAVGNSNYDGQFGMSFKVNSANGVVIDKLGAFDDQGNGITGSQGGGVRVAIFNIATQAIVSGLDVTISGTTDPLVGSYRMRSITPVTLPAGNYVIITRGYVGEKFYNRNQTGALNPVGDNAGGALTFLNTVYYGNVATFGFPDNVADAGNPNEYISGTFNYALNVSNNKIVTVTATDTHGNVTTATATVTLTNTSNSCATPAPVMAYAARNVQTEAPVVLDNVSMTVKVYPNPSSGQFTVQLYNLKATKVSLQVIDANGQVVVQREASLSSKTPVLSIPVDISKHASGIYLIKVISADGVQTAKVVVSK